MLDKDELIYTKILNHNATAKEIIDYIDNLHKEISKLKTDKICNKVEEEVLQEYRNKINSLERLLEGQLYRNYIYYKDLAKQYQGSCIPKQKIKELLDNNLEKENNEYILNSNACQCLVRKLIKILEGE